MNALGLPGASIDGILGFTILARFRLEIDPSAGPHDLDPAEPCARRSPGAAARRTASSPAELQAMNALGPLAKGLAFLMGKQPEEERHPRASWAWSGPRTAIPARASPPSGSCGSWRARPRPAADLRAGDDLVRDRRPGRSTA